MEDLGTRLRQAREAQGISLKDIATKTKIAVTALEALERNDFSRLPGGIFGRAFVRSYALEIGMDPESTVNDFQIRLSEIEREAAERGAVRPEVTADDREFLARQHRAVRALRIGLVILALALAATAVWMFESRRTKQTSVEAAPPATDAVALPAVAPPAVAHPQMASSLEVPSAGPAGPTSLSTEAAMPAGVPGAAGPNTADVRQAAARVVADIEVTAECWVWVLVDGQLAVSRLFRAGEHQTFEAEREVVLDLGNAGGVKLRLNGAPAKPLGLAGAHTTTRITRDTLAQLLQ